MEYFPKLEVYMIPMEGNSFFNSLSTMYVCHSICLLGTCTFTRYVEGQQNIPVKGRYTPAFMKLPHSAKLSSVATQIHTEVLGSFCKLLVVKMNR